MIKLNTRMLSGTQFDNWESTYSTVSSISSNWTIGQFGITIDGNGSSITTGIKGYLRIPYDCEITGWDLVADISGNMIIDLWKDTYSNFPPTSSDTIAGGITGTEIPKLDSQMINRKETLSSWNSTLSSDDWIAFNVLSSDTISRTTLTIRILKS